MTLTNIPADPHLASFPRPANDTGRGLHFDLDTRQSDLQRGGEYMQRMHMTWTTLYVGDEQQGIKAAKFLRDNFGIFSVIRIEARADAPKPPPSWAGYARAIVASGVAPLLQLFNEPTQEGFGIADFAKQWGARAEAIVQEGAWVGLQTMDEEPFAKVCSQMSAAVKARLFLCPHPYGANHPPMYPLTIGKTPLEDDTTILRFLTVADWARKYIGFVPPMIGTEGGWLYTDSSDTTMPKIQGQQWVDWSYLAKSWFRSGRITDGTYDAGPLPDYLIAINDWLLRGVGWPANSWLDGIDWQVKMQLIDKLSVDPVYVRQFGYNGYVPPPPPIHECPQGQHWDESAQICVEDTPLPDSELFVDPRITWLTITRPQITQYRIHEVWLYDSKPIDDPESEGGIDIYVVVRDSRGVPIEHEAVTQRWPTGSSTHYTRNGIVQFQMSGDSSFDPAKGQVGPYTIKVGDAHVGGLGLPLKQHVLYLIVVAKPATA